jgi:hypothetical protein
MTEKSENHQWSNLSASDLYRLTNNSCIHLFIERKCGNDTNDFIGDENTKNIARKMVWRMIQFERKYQNHTSAIIDDGEDDDRNDDQ